jgi:hypothetical protein
MGSWKAHKDYRKFLREDGDEPMSANRFATIVRAERGPFHGMINLACGNVKPGARKQRFYLTFVARYHGLSRGGIRLLAHYGYLIKQTKYDDMEQAVLAKQMQRNRYETALKLRCININQFTCSPSH